MPIRPGVLKHSFVFVVALLLLPLYALAQSAGRATTKTDRQEAASSRSETRRPVDYGQLPLAFEENQGQVAGPVRFLARPTGQLLLLGDKEATLVLPDRREKPASPGTSAARFARVRIRFPGASDRLKIVPSEVQEGVSNYLLGNDPAKWRTHVANYARVAYQGLYPGIDLVFYGNQRHLEHDFIVQPGADYRQITLAVAGGGKVRVSPDGSVAIKTAGGSLRFSAPKIYQKKDGREVLVAGRFRVQGQHRLGFVIGEYDKNEPLIIDPILSYSTYLAGTQGEAATGIATDADGNAYLTGYTFSTDFPTAQPLQANCNNCPVSGSPDAFVTKVNPAGTALVYSTYLGGSSYDQPFSIAVDGSGNAVVGGLTTSTDFPTRNPLPITFPQNQTEGFVASLSADGSALNFSTFLGGIGYATVGALTTDSQRNVYALGTTSSPDFPVTPATNVIGTPAGYPLTVLFVAKFSSAGQLVFATTIGPDPQQQSNGTFFPVNAGSIAVDSGQNVYLGGAASQGFMVTPGALQTAYTGPAPFCGSCTMGFVAKMKPDGSAFWYSTYLGGSGGDQVVGLAVDAAGNAFVSGNTGSPDFPVTPGALQTAPAATFVSKVNSTGTALIYSTYLGGTTPSAGFARGLAINSSGEAYVTGFTSSADFPLKNPIQSTIPPGQFGSGSATYVSKLNATGSALLFSTLFSGSIGTQSAGLALGPASGPESVYVAGVSFDPDLPTTSGAFQTTVAPAPPFTETSHAFVTKFDLATASPAVCLNQNSLYFFTSVNTDSYATPLTLTNCGNAALEISQVSTTGLFKETDNCRTPLEPGASCTVNVVFHPTERGQFPGTLAITGNASPRPLVIPLEGQGVAAVVQFSTNLLQLDDQLVGHKGAATPLFVFNQGDDLLQISSVKLGGHDFSVDASNCTQQPVQPFGLCLIFVTFHPRAAGLQTAVLTMADNAADSPQSVTVQGTGLTSYVLPTVASVTPLALQQGADHQSLTVFGTGFFPASKIRVNGSNIATTYNSETFLSAQVPTHFLKNLGELTVDVFTPPPGGGASNATTVTLYQIMPISANALVFEPFGRKIYATISSNAATNANTIARIDPAREKVERYTPIGNGPNALGLSERSKFLFVGLDADHAVREFNLETEQFGSMVSLPLDATFGTPTTAFQFAGVPGKPENDYVVSLRRLGSPSEAGVALVRSGKLQATLGNEYPQYVATDSICFLGDPNTVYGSNGYQLLNIGIQDHVHLSVLAAQPTPNGFSGLFGCDQKYIYGYSGLVFDPVANQTIGSYPLTPGSFGNGIVVDSSVGRTFIVTYGLSGLLAFDQKTFAQVGSLPLPPNVYEPYSLLRWGSDGFAFLNYNYTTSAGDLILMRSGVAKAPETTNPVPKISSVHPEVRQGYENFVLTVRGRNYVPGAVIRWNGADRTTVFVSSTELQADIPASDVERMEPVEIVVCNPPQGGGESNVAHYHIKDH
ncbi:MAG TPA: SBBP repeat-containing protein [Candidatus Saccharimonadales bacterium]|nr:SBBP repeat-containing protein [Candidatus Saccharimonadales bacterium]